MVVRMDKTYTFEKENLFAAPYPQAITGTFGLAPGQGELKRGSLIAIGTGDKGSLVAAALTAGTPVFVLADDADTGSATTGDAIPCTGYRSGHFLDDQLITGSDYKLKAADLEKLRQFNIYTSTGVAGEEA